MFSRAAKSVVKSIGQRKCYIGEENMKARVFCAAGEIGQTLSQYAKIGSKVPGSSVHNSHPRTSLLMQTAEKSRSLATSQAQKVQDPRTESFPQKCQRKNNAVPSYFANRELDLERVVTGLRDKDVDLVSASDLKKQTQTSGQHPTTDFPLSETKVTGQMWALSRIPTAQQDSSASRWRQLEQTRSEGLPFYTPLTTQSRNADLRTSGVPKATSEAMIAEKLWLGEPDCGEGQPDRPTRGPCHPPCGPCVPMKKPGYPAKPRSPKKDFCYDCPPKRPCNLNKCPPDDCEGTCGMASIGRRNLKLNSESQANRSVTRLSLESPAIKCFASSTWNFNRPRNHQANNHQEARRQFCSSCDSKSSPNSPKKPEPPSRPIPKEPKVLYRKCPPLPKLPKLPECPKIPEAPKCPPPPKLPVCPECPKPLEQKTEKPPTASKTSPSTKAKKTAGKFPSNSDCHADRLEKSSSEKSSTKKHEDQRIDHPKASRCCAIIPEKDGEMKDKSLWDKISKCTKRKMSTCHHASQIRNYIEASNLQNSRRHLWTSGTLGSSFSSKTDPPSADAHPQWKTRKCKTVQEVCGEEINAKLEALECKPMECPKSPNVQCYPEKPRCAEVRKPAERESAKDQIVGRKAKTDSNCNIIKNCRPPATVKAVEKIVYTKRSCEPPTLLKLGPCPSLPSREIKINEDQRESTCKASSQKLPTPPSPPINLCRCPPPPKLQPGPCPCCDENQELTNIVTEPCAAKPKYPCPEPRVFYCPPKDGCEDKKEKVCNADKKATKP